MGGSECSTDTGRPVGVCHSEGWISLGVEPLRLAEFGQEGGMGQASR